MVATTMRLFLIVATIVVGAHAHGYLAYPKSRNFVSSNICPHCLNAGGPAKKHGRVYPHGGRHGMCGDPFDGPRDHEAGGKYAPGVITGTFRKGAYVHLTMAVTANHRGAVEYRVCRYRAGSPAAERRALTDACLNKHVLRRPNGSRWTYLGNGPEQGYGDGGKLFRAVYVIPRDLECDGRHWKCVLQMHWVTGNTCGDPRIPARYRVPGLRRCGVDGLWPEEFWNCADIRVV